MQDVKLFFEKYDISEDGIVTNRHTGMVIPHQITDGGYHRVSCWINRKGAYYRVSCLVALKYIPNPMGYPEVNHKDGDKDNNNWTNLEWCTRQQNMDHAVRNGLTLQGIKHPMAKLKDDDVLTIRARISSGESYRKVHEDYSDKVAWWNFRDICRGKIWKHLL